jgi:ABC-2 type transport system ATP-binding protein
VFMSTHTLDVAERLVDRIGIIHHGRLVALGTLEELRQQSRMDGDLEGIFLRLTAEPGDETAPGSS